MNQNKNGGLSEVDYVKSYLFQDFFSQFSIFNFQFSQVDWFVCLVLSSINYVIAPFSFFSTPLFSFFFFLFSFKWIPFLNASRWSQVTSWLIFHVCVCMYVWFFSFLRGCFSFRHGKELLGCWFLAFAFRGFCVHEDGDGDGDGDGWAGLRGYWGHVYIWPL